MPHPTIKLWPGKSEQQKKKLAEEITKAVMSALNYGDESVSVGIARHSVGSKQGRWLINGGSAAPRPASRRRPKSDGGWDSRGDNRGKADTILQARA